MSTLEETILKSIVFNPLMPEALIVEAWDALADLQEAHGVWTGCPSGCTCDDCAAFDAARAA